QALADVVERAPGVETLNVGYSGLQGGPCLRANQATDVVDALWLDLRANVDEHQGFDGGGIARGVGHGIRPTHRHADEDEGGQHQLADHGRDVPHHGVAAVVLV